MNISTRQLNAFLLVARLRSFSRAAEQMFVTQSGLSVMVRELETQLGFRLLDRTTRNVALTEYGSRFLAVAEQNVRGLEEAASLIGRSAGDAGRSFSVGAPPTAASTLLPWAITEFHRRNRDLRIRLVDADLSSIARLVREGSLDIGLGMFIKPADGLRRTPLFRYSLMAVRAASGAPRVARKPWSALAGEAMIGLPPENPIQQLIARQLARAGHRRAPEFVVNYLDTQIALAEAGAGVAVVPTQTLPVCRKRKVIVEPLVDPVVELDFYQVSNPARALPAGATAFTDFLREHIAGWTARTAVTGISRGRGAKA